MIFMGSQTGNVSTIHFRKKNTKYNVTGTRNGIYIHGSLNTATSYS